jgi:cytochrome P450
LDLTGELGDQSQHSVYDKKLSAIISAQMQSLLQHDTKSSTSTRSIAQLAMANVPPSPSLVRNTVHQIKTFLFAGQDTTATLVQWLCYELSKNPEILSRLREEHDLVFGPNAFSAGDMLSQPGEADRILASQLPYTTAVVKETLRLHPPAATARLCPTGTDFEVEINGKPTRVDGLRVYPSQWLIHRNPAIWGPDAHSFKPERWLDTEYMAKLPAGAFRAFEHGPRNCIGQDLAMVEGKVVLAMIARGFAFEKIGLTGKDGEEEVYNNMAVTSVPCDGMRMKVKKVA